jgi:hypothetical protein
MRRQSESHLWVSPRKQEPTLTWLPEISFTVSEECNGFVDFVTTPHKLQKSSEVRWNPSEILMKRVKCQCRSRSMSLFPPECRWGNLLVSGDAYCPVTTALLWTDGFISGPEDNILLCVRILGLTYESADRLSLNKLRKWGDTFIYILLSTYY